MVARCAPRPCELLEVPRRLKEVVVAPDKAAEAWAIAR
jgi:hypothetical protein